MYSLTLGDAFYSAYPGADMTKLFTNWRRSIRRIGGCWQGTADFVGSPDDMLDMYLNGLTRRVTEQEAGHVTWDGFIGQIDFTIGGVTYSRNLMQMANAIKAIYTKITENVIVNPSVEAAPWAAELGATDPAWLLERVTTWHTHGDYSMHCVKGVLDPVQSGMEIDDTGIIIDDETEYQCRVSVNVISGVWVLKIQTAPGGVTLGKMKTSGTGEMVLTAQITEDNTYFGAIRVVLVEKTAGGAGEIYADDCRFTIRPIHAELSWYTDDESIAIYGRIEDILLEAEMTDAAAIAKVQKELARRAWPRSLAPSQLTVAIPDSPPSLSVTCFGWVWTLAFRYVREGGEDDSDDHVIDLVGASEFVTAGDVRENLTTYMIDTKYPKRLWDVLEDIMLTGDSTGAQWQGGVFADKLFDYMPAATAVEYHIKSGKFLAANLTPVDPWMVRPSLVQIDDMPTGPGEITGNIADDPRIVLLDEVEFVSPDKVAIQQETRMGK